MATYSAWDWNINAFRVFRDAKPVSIGDDPAPPRPRTLSILGAVPDKDVKLLPKNVRSIGTSPVAIGEIVRDPKLNTPRDAAAASRGGGDGIGDFGETAMSLAPILVVGAAIAAVIYFSKPRKTSR
jgi:hypothetical protein